MATDRHGERVIDDSFYLLFNASDKYLNFTLPKECGGEKSCNWIKVFDTSVKIFNTYNVFSEKGDDSYLPGSQIRVEARSLILLGQAN